MNKIILMDILDLHSFSRLKVSYAIEITCINLVYYKITGTIKQGKEYVQSLEYIKYIING